MTFLKENKTTGIVITHHVDVLRSSALDRIIVLNDGKIVQSGRSFDELVAAAAEIGSSSSSSVGGSRSATKSTMTTNGDFAGVGDGWMLNTLIAGHEERGEETRG